MTINFIAFEGVDGSGKSTVAKAVAEALGKKGLKVALTREPTDTWLGDAVRKNYKQDTPAYTEAFLFMADRANHVKWIKEKVAEGKLVITDRYSDSTVAYQAALIADEFGAPMGEVRDWLLSVNNRFILKPDVTILFDIDPEVSLARLTDRDKLTKFEKMEYLKQVRQNYLALAERSETTVVIDASQSYEEVVAEVLGVLTARL